jgi:cold shock CspA family protein
MYRGQFKMFNTGKGYGFIASSEFPQNIFCHTKSIWLPPGEFPSAGDECIFTVGQDRLGRAVANNVKIMSRRAPTAVDHPGQQYDDRMMSARRRVRERAERLWTHEGDR